TRCGQSNKPRKRKAELQFALPQVENAPQSKVSKLFLVECLTIGRAKILARFVEDFPGRGLWNETPVPAGMTEKGSDRLLQTLYYHLDSSEREWPDA
ncbi:MAG: hypothetical protein BECKG1743D_GA0114223_109361, partial [Candidatus Kentron sp. G]